MFPIKLVSIGWESGVPSCWFWRKDFEDLWGLSSKSWQRKLVLGRWFWWSCGWSTTPSCRFCDTCAPTAMHHQAAMNIWNCDPMTSKNFLRASCLGSESTRRETTSTKLARRECPHSVTDPLSTGRNTLASMRIGGHIFKQCSRKH